MLGMRQRIRRADRPTLSHDNTCDRARSLGADLRLRLSRPVPDAVGLQMTPPEGCEYCWLRFRNGFDCRECDCETCHGEDEDA